MASPDSGASRPGEPLHPIYTPQQNGMIERFFLTLKQECVWLHRFENRDQAFRVVADWLDRYDGDRPHSALGYLTPKEYREKLAA
jgi:putative transposase